MIDPQDRLSIGTLLRTFRWQIVTTWGLTLLETALFVLVPLCIGRSIDGLMNNDHTAFVQLLGVLAALVVVAVVRRIVDTRAYGTMRVELGAAMVDRHGDMPVSVVNARALMTRELVDFLEDEAPQAITAVIQVIASIAVLFSFHPTLAASTAVASIAMLTIYGLCARRFYALNQVLNTRGENQVTAIETRQPTSIRAHFLGLRKAEVQLSDTESAVYGAIFLILLSMLAFNLWFAVTATGALPGEVFSIVTYSYEFVQSAVTLPLVLQLMTRLEEISSRINRDARQSETPLA